MKRITTLFLPLFMALLALIVTPALATPAFIEDTTPATATNNGTINTNEYVDYTTGINSGFGNVIGSGSQLHIDSDATGALHIGLIKGPGDFNDAMVIYIDADYGFTGFATTSGFTDADDPCRRAISGYDGSNRSTLNFAPGFQANYAICLDTGFAGLWELTNGGAHPFVVALNRTTVAPGHYEMNLTLDDLGLAPGDSFRYVATYLNPSNAFRSDEFHGVSSLGGGNPGHSMVNLADGDFNEFYSYYGRTYCEVGEDVYDFPDESGVSIEITDVGDIFCLQVIEFIGNHPDATGATDGQNLRTGKYWRILGLDFDEVPATDYTLNLTLPYAAADENTRACKWLDGAGPGFGWNCSDSEMPTTYDAGVSVTRQNVTELSEWAVGQNVGPTAVTLQSLTAQPNTPGLAWLALLLVVAAALVGWRFAVRK
ncbi:MAG: hypothetical protein IAE79_27145 [Anaerolinea sp.]|nr:hypothetical protein [Anaerolinea sp.]